MFPDTHTVRRPASSALSTTHTEGGAGLGVEVGRLGVDVALITVQVEIVRAIDCASKCYTSHLSTFFFTQEQRVIRKDATVNVNSQTLKFRAVSPHGKSAPWSLSSQLNILMFLKSCIISF